MQVDYYQGQIDMGFTTVHYGSLVALHQGGAMYIKNELGADSVFEFGSGLGFFLSSAKNIGLDATGYGIDERERAFVLSKGIDPERYILGKRHEFKLDRRYDCAYCVEVAEHIEDDELLPIFTELAANCQYLYFTSTPHPTTPEEDLAWGHINLKDADGWKSFLGKCGWEFLSNQTQVTGWGMVFKTKAI